MSELSKYDSWLKDDGPAALVIREPLESVEGPDGVLFPATFAAAEDKSKFAGGYNIDTFPDGKNVCLVDSVGSQANRIEPLFGKPGYSDLVPQVVVEAGEHCINLLEAGHRAGDAIVRCSELQQELQSAFREVLKGNAEPLTQIAPTSLVFGVWDSRDTQAKLPRLLNSTIRAFNVRKLTRSAQYVPAIEYVDGKLLDEPQDKKTNDAYSERGFKHVPATASHGGVIADGGVRRDATLSLAALRLLAVRESGRTLSTDRTLALRRYVLGLALTALTAPQCSYLRQGCNLVPAEGTPREFKLVHGDGRREDVKLTHGEAVAYARAAAKEFGVGQNRTVAFDKQRAEKDVKGSTEKVKGKVSSLDGDARRFVLKQQGKNKPDVEVTTTEQTPYFKGQQVSTFSEVVIAQKNVEVELAGGVATKVTGK